MVVDQLVFRRERAGTSRDSNNVTLWDRDALIQKLLATKDPRHQHETSVATDPAATGATQVVATERGVLRTVRYAGQRQGT